MEESSASPSKSNRSTPRSSVDHSSTSHFHNLHLRFRSGSNASYNDAPTPPLPTEQNIRNEAVRSAKKYLLKTIRDDWAYPAQPVDKEDNSPVRVPLGYTVRVEGASDVDDDELGPSKQKTSPKDHNPYKFESPDAIGTSINEKKRKRRQLLEEELQCNEGLRIWIEQRNAWTQAVPKRPLRNTMPSPEGREIKSLRSRNASDSTDVSVTWPLPSNSPVNTSPSEASSSIDSIEVKGDTAEYMGPWLPIFPPLLPPDNPVRANIKPAAYDHIYSKVVIQQLTPSVPIPLTHMTYALVEGWKADGAWPPVGSDLPALPETGKKRSAVMNVIRMRRAQHRKLNSKDEDGGPVKKSIGAVKKALGVRDEGDFGIDFEDAERPQETELNSELNKSLLEKNP